MEEIDPVSIIENTDQKLVLQIDLSEWKLKKLCPNCSWAISKIQDQTQKRYQVYVLYANKRFGINSVPLCYKCWGLSDKCLNCDIPLTDPETDFGNIILSQTTVVNRCEDLQELCIACSLLPPFCNK